MIGPFNEENVIFALLPKCEAFFRTANANTGFANLYNGPQAGGTITGTLTNMTSGFGYRATEKDYNFDGTNDTIITTYDKAVDSSLQLSITFRLTIGVAGVAKGIWGFYNDINNYFVIQQNVNNTFTIVLRLAGATAVSLASGVVVSAGQTYNVSFTISGAAVKIYVNNDTPLNRTMTYAGSASFSNCHIGSYNFGGTQYTFNGQMAAFIMQNVAKSDSDIAALHTILPDLGNIVGYETGVSGVMGLLSPANRTLHNIGRGIGSGIGVGIC